MGIRLIKGLRRKSILRSEQTRAIDYKQAWILTSQLMEIPTQKHSFFT